MWKSKINWVYYFSIFLLLTVSCKTQKQQKTTGKELSQYELEYTTLNIPKATFTFVQKQNAMNVNGSIRIKKDSIIIISFQPFLGVEVGRASITQQSLTIVDRINKRYFKADFDTFGKETGVNLNYHIFQSIFTNALFVYDKPGQVQISAFEEVRVGDLSLLQRNKGGVIQEFNINEDKRVLSGRVFADNEPYTIGWNYLNFNSLETGYFFPHLVKINLSDGNKPFQLDVAYNKVELNKNLNFQSSVPDSYTQVTLEELLKMLQ